MGAAIDAVGDSIEMSTRNPNLLVGGVVAMLLLFVVGGILSFIPLLGPMVTNIVVTPIALAGMVGMANAAATGSSNFGDFTDGIGDHSTTLMGAFALLFAIWLGIGMVFVVVMVFLGVGLMSAVPANGDPSAVAGALGGTFLLIFVLFGLVVLLITIVTQFLDVAVVVGEKDATGAFGEAVELVTGGPLSVLGYSLLRGILAAIVIGVPFVGGLAAVGWGLDDAGTVPILIGVGVMILALPVGFTYLYAYHVAYYRRRIGATT